MTDASEAWWKKATNASSAGPSGTRGPSRRSDASTSTTVEGAWWANCSQRKPSRTLDTGPRGTTSACGSSGGTPATGTAEPLGSPETAGPNTTSVSGSTQTSNSKKASDPQKDSGGSGSSDKPNK